MRNGLTIGVSPCRQHSLNQVYQLIAAEIRASRNTNFEALAAHGANGLVAVL